MGRYSHDDDNPDAESEALILHRLGTDPSGRPQVHTIPSQPYEDDIEDQSDEYLEKRRLRALEDQHTSQVEADLVDNQGRPAWFRRLLYTIGRWPVYLRLLLGTGAFLFLVGLFYFALGSSDVMPTSPADTTWSWAGNIWHGGKIPFTFPGDVGYPGPTEMGKPAQLAQEDKTAGIKKPWSALPIEVNLPEGKYGDFNPFLHMGPLTPYTPSRGFGVDDATYHKVPQGCQIEQVHYLSRHGSRYPTSGAPVNKIREMLSQSPRPIFSGPLAFLNDYEYRLGKELLVPLGRQQLYDEGVAASIYYGKLILADIAQFGSLFARAGSQHRIVESARNWLAGALGLDWQKQTSLEIQIEAPGFNTTLAPYFACPTASDEKFSPGFKQMQEWIDDYANDAAKRLQPYVSGVEITPTIVNALQQLCSYDTVAGFPSTELCSLFTKEEWLGYEYTWDLEFYAGYSSGSLVGPAQGVGWINEFLSRLQGKTWDVKTQTSENSTFNTHPRTFPVDRRFYLDVTHDSVIANVLGALNLPDFSQDLPVHRPNPDRKFRTSQVVPFGARLVFEKIACPSTATEKEGQRYIRMLLNDAIVPLAQLKPCEDRKDGLCSMDRFLESQKDRMERVKWERCFEK